MLCILTPLLAAPLGLAQVSVPPRPPLPVRTAAQTAFETARVIDFDEAARTGLDPNAVLPPFPDARKLPRFREEFGWYDYNDSKVQLEADTGRVLSYFTDYVRPSPLPVYNSDGSPGPRLVSDEQAVSLAKRFFAAAGWGDSVPRLLLDDHDHRMKYAFDGLGAHDGIQVHLLPAVGGIPYEGNVWDAHADIDRRTGQLEGFSGPRDLLTPPLSLVPRGTAEQARAVALGFGAELRGEALDEAPTRPVALCLWLPLADADHARDALGHPYGAKVLRAIRAKQALLVYRGLLRGGSREACVVATVDAETGEMIDAEPLRPFSGGGAGGGGGSRAGAAPAGALDVPLVARPWQVSTGGKGWDAWTAPTPAALKPDPAPAPTVGSKLSLTDGRAAFPALYDPATGLVVISGKTYRPGPALAALLKRRTKG